MRDMSNSLTSLLIKLLWEKLYNKEYYGLIVLDILSIMRFEPRTLKRTHTGCSRNQLSLNFKQITKSRWDFPGMILWSNQVILGDQKMSQLRWVGEDSWKILAKLDILRNLELVLIVLSTRLKIRFDSQLAFKVTPLLL